MTRRAETRPVFRVLGAALVLLLAVTACTDARTAPSSSVPAATSTPSAPVPASPSLESPAGVASPSPSESTADPGVGGSILRVQAAGVRLRSAPSAGARVLATLPAGAIVSRVGTDVVEADDLAWYEVRFGEVGGWVASGPYGSWLASVTNGRIGFACTGCGEDDARAAVSVEPDGSGLRVLLPAFGSPTWSPDGQRVVISHEAPGAFDRSLTLMNADGSGATALGPGYSADWSPDGERLAFSNPVDGTLVLIGPDGRRSDLKVNDRGAPGSLSWSPDGSRLAFVAIDCDECPIGEPVMGDVPSGIFLFDPATGLVERVVERGYYGQLTWSADGSSLTYFSTDLSVNGNEVRRLELATKSITTLLSDSSLLNGWMLSPDGGRLAAMRTDGIVVADADGDDARVVVDRSDEMNPMPAFPRWSPDGAWIIFDMYWVTGDAIETWIVPADGSGEARRVAEDAYEAAWQPLLVPLTD